ncbi:cAMP-dependent protein kinase catalytic subunit 3-like [Teleopsis dalmanni]|uniref:cAMP-dependent protein kinase catalytic subunit 3-like n=1 Tax=Teleopsis dalmanni TaxID=139649 RepID=UPI0018CFCD3B|nr:cAMP-dependent protein kinase catalytic subunit 3-like [Teleopsis dalmanni]
MSADTCCSRSYGIAQSTGKVSKYDKMSSVSTEATFTFKVAPKRGSTNGASISASSSVGSSELSDPLDSDYSEEAEEEQSKSEQTEDSEESKNKDDGNETDDESESVETTKSARKYHLDDFQMIKTVGEC